ncbi:MAG: helix-turn-helix domain-containing protein [Bacteroidales bacterium]|nr:helix-turn-helix domain-containing protein [Bacteroidales bacterium]
MNTVLHSDNEKNSSQHPAVPIEWVDTFDVMRLLRCSRPTVRALRRRGLLTAHCFPGGNRVYYDRREIDRVLCSNVVMENGKVDG